MDSLTRECCSMRLRDWMLSENEAVIDRWNDDLLERSFIWTSSELLLFHFWQYIYDSSTIGVGFDLTWFDLMIPYGVLPGYVHILICWYGIHEYSRLLCTFRAFAIILNGKLTMQECWPLYALHLVHRSTLDAYAVGQSSCPKQREAVKPLWYMGHFSPSTSPSTRMSTST